MRPRSDRTDQHDKGCRAGWQREETEVILSRGVERSFTVIGVLLPGAPEIPDSQAFLRSRQWVRFQNLEDSKALDELTWGIVQSRPR